MKVMYIGLFLCSSLVVANEQPKNLQVIEKSFKELSKGLSSIIGKGKIVKGATRVINSITDLTQAIALENNLTPKDTLEIQNALLDFDAKLEAFLHTKRDLSKGVKEKKLLAEGLTDLIYHVFVLTFFRDEVGYHIKHIIGSLLKIITSVIEDESQGHADLLEVQTLLNEALGNKFVATRSVSIDADGQLLLNTPLTPDQKTLLTDFRILLNSFTAILLNPKMAYQKLKDMFAAALQIVATVFADAKFDEADKENIEVALEALITQQD